MQILEVALPVVGNGQVMIKNYYSLVSAGTEGSTVKTARKGYIGKAKERPQQVKQVIDTLKSQGPVQTYRAVMKKLDAYSPLGYSCVGEVVSVGAGVTGFCKGDFVACGGLSASHAEVVSVPEKLCVKLETKGQDLDLLLKGAAYNTLGAIAMQGVRQADLKLGESCAVIGLGLLGQLSGLLLQASGVRVVGVDIDPGMVDIAGEHCVDLALERGTAGIEDRIMQFTGGLGCDAVIITAASASLDPINFAGAVARKRGRIVVVGAVPTGFDREPHFYKKELEVRMSCSYGPGRYDPAYEEKGQDYPAAYVRWTEKRNMEAFQQLIASGRIDPGYLTTHIFDLEEAPSAYDMMMEKSEPFIGILIRYDTGKNIQTSRVLTGKKVTSSDVNVGFVGAGSYALSHLLPNIPKSAALRGVMTASSTSSRSVADRYGFEFCTGSEADILENNEINTVFIATRHDSHGDYVIRALENGKHVFVEKPLCLEPEELEKIKCICAEGCGRLMVGYNRRFAPLAVKIKQTFGSGPMAMNYRINSGSIPADSWIQDMEIGGGRILGEVCHFVDFLTFINGSMPVSVYAVVMEDAGDLNDVLNVSLRFENGSIGSISYFANGDKGLAKERVEVYSSGCTAVLDDFRVLEMYTGGKKTVKKLMGQDKGQKVEVERFIGAICGEKEEVIPLEEIFNTSEVTFKILESIRIGAVVSF